MKKLLILLSLIAPPSLAQQTDIKIHATSTLGPQSRYEIVQSTLAARWTFRLDRVCGSVSQLVSTKNDGVAWEQMAISGLQKCLQDGKVRYQLFSSGIAARHTFLLNTENGRTWVVTATKDSSGNDFLKWFPFEE